MASGPITSWQIDGETVETVSDFILGGSKISADGDCSHEMKRHFLLGRKVMTNLDMYGCESWTIKKTEHGRIDALELWCWRRLLRVPWTARRSNQSILKEISPGCSLVGLMLKLKLQYFGHLMQRADFIWNDPDPGKDWGQEEKGMTEDEKVEWLTQWTWVWEDSRSWWWTGSPGLLQFMGLQRVGHDWATELNWTDLLPIYKLPNKNKFVFFNILYFSE